MNRLDGILFDLKQAIDDLIHEIKLIQKEIEKLKEKKYLPALFLFRVNPKNTQ